jgi:Flp pilus assembly protein TadB
VSKERARRRAEREREAAHKQSARAAEAERRERKAARRRALENAGHRIGLKAPKRPGGTLARRRQRQHLVVVGLLVLLLVVGFAVRPDWPARLAFVVVAVLAYPVLRVLMFKRV